MEMGVGILGRHRPPGCVCFPSFLQSRRRSFCRRPCSNLKVLVRIDVGKDQSSALRLPAVHAPFSGKWACQVRGQLVRAWSGEPADILADKVRRAKGMLANLPEDLTDAKVADLQKVCMSLGASKTGKKQVLIDRINRMLEVYTQQLDEDEAAEEEAEQVLDEGYEADVGDDEDTEEESFIRASQNDDLMGDLEGESSSEGNMLSLIGKPREQQLEELEAWTVRDMRAALNRQEVKNIGANTRVNLIPKMMALLEEDKVDAAIERHSLTAVPDSVPFSSEDDLEENLNLLTMSDLRDLLRQREQQVKGTKSELIDRLTPLLLRESAVAEFVAGLGAADVEAQLEARGLPTGMDEAAARAALTEALVLEEDYDPAAAEQEREQLALERERLVAQEGQERWARILGPCLRVGVICGGTGASREASLHSARTLLDQLDTIHHLQAAAWHGVEMDPEQYGINVVPCFIDSSGRTHLLSVEQLQSHSAADLDFLLAHTDQAFPSMEEAAEQLKEVADVMVPMATGDLAEEGQLQALLQKAGMPFVGSPSEAVVLAGSRARLAGEMERLGFPTLQHLALTVADFTGDEDVVELAGQWADALSEQKGQEEEQLLEAVSPPRDGPVFFNPFGRSSPAQSGSSPEGGEASTSGQGAGDQTAAEQGAVIDVEAESSALAQPWGRRLWNWAQAAGLDAHSGVFVAKPGGVGRGDRPGANVVMARGLPAAALAARDLMEQGHESVVVERHMGGAVRVSVAVVEGREGPIALLPSQEELICPEATFLDAGLEAERQAARREGYSEEQIEAVLAGQRDALLQDTHGMSYAQCLEEDFPDTRLRQSCPPRLPKELVWGLRQGAARLFKELGLRDAAVIEGWVELPKEEPASSSADDAAEGVTVPALALPSLHHRLYPRTKAVLTPADLEKAAHVHEDRDPSFDMQGEYLSDGTEGYKRIFDEAEAKLKWKEAMLSMPPPEVDDPCDLPADSLCRWDSGTIMFDAVHAALDLQPTGPLFAQAAEAGLSHQATLRHVISSAARRAGLPAIPTPFAESIQRTIFMTLPPPRDYEGELDAQLAKDEVYTEEGLFNEALVERPAYDEPPKRQRRIMDPNATFVPVWAHPRYGDRLDIGLERQVDESLKAQEEVAGSGREEEEEEQQVMPQRIWILTGGDSSERRESLASGLAAWLRLRTQIEVQPELFLLAPRNAGADLAERKGTLLQRRAELLAMVGAEEDLPEELQVQNIRRPPLRPVEPHVMGVWAVPYAAALHATPEDIHEVCERALRAANTADHRRAEEDVAEDELRKYVAQQLVTAEVHGVAGTWGGNPNQLPPPPRYMDLTNFAMEAEAAQAVVLLALHGGMGENGTVQALLQGYGVPITGPSWDAASVAIDKAATAEVLAELEVHNVSTAPKFPVTLQRLLAAADDEEECHALFEEMQDAIGGSNSLVIKPAADGGPAAVARLGSHTDLGWYACAVADRDAAIPAGVLEQPPSRQQAGAPIPLPLTPPPVFVVEPFVDTESVRMVTGEDGRPSIEWTGDSRWLHVSIGLLGQVGTMRALGPTLKLPDQTGMQTVRVTPPPGDLVREDVLAGVRARAEMVADALGLNGAASLEALMHAESADLVLIEANAIPDISPGSDLFQQAMMDEELGCPTPAELLKELIAFSNFAEQPAPAVADDAELAAAADKDAGLASSGWQYGAMASLPDEDFEDEDALSIVNADQ